jgi:hypothetical protein
MKWIVAFLILVGPVWAKNPPHIGYAYPAGGQQGTTFHVNIGGQYLEGSTNVFVSGEGVNVDIRRYSVRYDPKRLRQFYRNKENGLAAIEGMEEKSGKEYEKQQRRIDLSTEQHSPLPFFSGPRAPRTSGSSSQGELHRTPGWLLGTH